MNNKPSTVYAKRVTMKPTSCRRSGAMRLDTIGPADVETYKARKLKDGQSAKSVNNHLAILRKMLNLAVEWGELPHVAAGEAAAGSPHADIQFLSFEETDRFLQAAAPEWKAFLVTALKTGLRVGELLALKWEDVDLVAGRLVVRRTLWHDQEGPPKGGPDARGASVRRGRGDPEGAPAPAGRPTSSASRTDDGSPTAW